MYKELILGRADKAHTPTALAVVPTASVEVALVEEHVVRAVTISVRSRPVEAAGTDAVDNCPATPARSGQEDCTVGFELVSPIALRDTIAAEARIRLVSVAKTVVAAAPVVWQQNYSVYSIYYRFGISYSAACASCIKHIHPFVFR